MATCNFSLRYNSDYLYAFCESSDFEKYLEEYIANNGIDDDDCDCDELREALYSEWYDDSKEFYLERLEAELGEVTAYGTGLYMDFTEYTTDHITDGDQVATVRKYINFAGGEFMVMCSVDFEAGYYEGFALDWNIKSIEGVNSWHSSYDCMPDAYDCENMLEDETDLNAGLRKALAPKLQARLEEALNDVTGAIEKALKAVSPYHLTGTCASNGEGFYMNHKNENQAA